MEKRLALEVNEFCSFLQKCSSSCKREEPGEWEASHCSIQLDSESFSALVFPPGACTVFAEFCGPQETELVVFYQSNEEDTAQVSPGINYSCKNPEEATLDESCEESCEQTPPPSPPLPFTIAHSTEVKVGKLLSGQRVFLSKTIPFYDSQTTSSNLHLVTFTDSRVTPLSLDKARYLCSLYSMGARKTHSLPAVWVICESQLSKTVALGCSINRELLNIFTISTEQCLSDGSSDAKSGGSRRKILGHVGWAFSEYDITGQSSVTTPAATVSPSLSQGAEITAQFSWADPEFLLNPPPDNAEGLIRISMSPGYMFSPVLSVHQELSTLIKLSKIALGEFDWSGDDPEQVIDSAASIETRVEKFLEDSTTPYEHSLDVTVISPATSNAVYEPRKDLDFVERLWLFCKDLGSLRELQEVLAAVFKAVLLGRVQPLVHRRSVSTLSSLFREVLHCPALEDRQTLAPKFQCLLAGTKALDCLVEIGVEKLKFDYQSFFVCSDLATSSQLEAFLSTSEAGSICDSLYKLHCVLELVSSALSFLNLPSGALLSLTKVALDYYKEASIDGHSPSPTFSLPLPAFSQTLKSVSSLCSKLSPTVFTVSTFDNSRDENKHSLKVVRSEPLFGRGADSSLESRNICCHVYNAVCAPVSLTT